MKLKKNGLPSEDTGKFPFHYGDEADLYTFYRIPKILFEEPVFKDLSTDAKLLYGMMLDRMALSMRNNWLDENGRVYIYFSVENIMERLKCGNGKCTKLLQELDDVKGVGLITRVKQGLGKADIIYVHKCASVFPMSNVKRCENRMSEDAKNKSLEITISHANKTEINNIENSEKESIYPSGNASSLEECKEEIREQIEYYYILKPYNQDILDDIVDLMADVLTSNKETITVNGDEKPADVVKNQLKKLDSGHIEYVVESLMNNTSKVRNIRSYLITTLYNAPMTTSSYYTALVSHDLNYGKY